MDKKTRLTVANFQGRGGFMKLGHFNKHFLENSRKNSRAGENFEVFSPRYFFNYILNGKFNLRMDTVRAFFSKSQGNFFYFQKRAGENFPP